MPINPKRPAGRPPRQRTRLLLGILLLLLAACSPLAARQAAPIETQAGFSATGQAPLPAQWWRSFNDPDLNALVDQALDGNLTLQSAWDRLDQARAAARKAGAELIPQIGADSSISTTSMHSNGRSDSTQSVGVGLAASYELDLWGRIGSTSEAARLDALASAEQLQTAALTLSAQVAATWFQWREQQGQLDVLARQLKTNSQTLELVTLQFRTGQTAIADLLQQRQVVENRRGELALAAGRARVLENQLALLTGVAPGQLPALTAGQFGELPPLPDTGLQSSLVERRPDVRGAWLQVLAADQRVAAAVADRFPRLTLTGRANTAAEQIEELFDDWLSSLTAGLLAPLVDGGRRRAEVDRSRAAAAEALHAYGQTVLKALAEVEDSLTLEQRRQEYLVSIDRQLELATQATARIRDRYLNGADDYQRVLIAQLSEQQLQRTRLLAHRELFENRVNLCRALAGGWELARPPTTTSRGD